MKWSERITGMLRAGSSPRETALREVLVAGRTAKLSENYTAALLHFDQALDMARSAAALGDDPTPITSLSVHRAETLIRLRQWADAAAFIEASRASAPSLTRTMHAAYMDCALGLLEQARGDLNASRTAYESALKGARGATKPIIGAEGRAMGHLADLYLRDGNASYAAHLLKDALAKLGTSSDLELSGYFVGLLGQAMSENGQSSDGLHFIQRALMLAEQFQHRLYERHWGMILGQRALDEGRYLDARGHYQRALHLFDAEKPTPAFVALHVGLSKASIYVRDHDTAIQMAETALEASHKLVAPPVDPPIALIITDDAEALARGALGLALRAAGRGIDAMPHLQALVDTITDEQATRDRIDVLRGLGAALSETDDYNAAVTTYQRALAMATKFDDPLEIALTHRDLGLIYQRREEYVLAVQEWTQAITIYDSQNAYAQVARLHCDLGGARRSMGLVTRALRDYEQALMTLNNVDANDLETRGLVLSNAANVYAESGDAESADAFFTESISIAERTNDMSAEAIRSGNYGWFLIVVGRPRRAIATLERGLRLSETLNLTLQAAVQTDNIGLAHDSLSEYPTARAFHEKALASLNGSDARHWRGSIQINLANTLLSLNDTEQADSLCASVLEDARATNDIDLLIRALTTQARTAILSGDLIAAAAPLDEAIILARKLDSKRLLADLLYLRSQHQAGLHELSQGREAWDEAVKLYTALHMPQAKIEPSWLQNSV